MKVIENVATKIDIDAKQFERNKELDDELEEFPLGSLNLPPYLDKRRVENRIPRCFFRQQYIGDNCLIFSLEDGGGDTFVPGGLIVKTDEYRQASKRGNCHGILVGAGLTALDYLRSNGVELGHTVMFVRHAPFHPVVGNWGDGGDIRGVDLTSGDIRGSRELAVMREEGRLETKVREVDYQGQKLPEHYYACNGEEWSPIRSITNENYVE